MSVSGTQYLFYLALWAAAQPDQHDHVRCNLSGDVTVIVRVACFLYYSSNAVLLSKEEGNTKKPPEIENTFEVYIYTALIIHTKYFV